MPPSGQSSVPGGTSCRTCLSVLQSLWGPWWEMLDWASLLRTLSAFASPSSGLPHPQPRPSRTEWWQDFMWTCHGGDPPRHGSVFRVAGQDCGSVQEQESCNLGENKAQGKFGNRSTKMCVFSDKKYFWCWRGGLVCFLSELFSWWSSGMEGWISPILRSEVKLIVDVKVTALKV